MEAMFHNDMVSILCVDNYIRIVHYMSSEQCNCLLINILEIGNAFY